MLFRSRYLMMACAIIVAIAVAACGSSGSTTSTPTTHHVVTHVTSTTAPAPTGAPIRLGAIGSCGGALASGLGGVCPTDTAWADYVNAHGGINGHPVKMTVLDDSGNPTTSLTDLKQLIDQDHVQAIVGEYSVDDPAWDAIIDKSGIPVIGGGSTEPTFSTDANFFPSGSSEPAYEYAEAKIAKQDGDTKLGMMECAEAPTCATNAPVTQLMIKNGTIKGQKLVYVTKISATAPSFTSECLAAKAAGVQALLVADAGAIAQRVVDECAQQNYHPLIMSGGGVINSTLAKDPAFANSINTETNPSLYGTNPETKILKAALAKYAPQVNQSQEYYNDSVPSAWSGGLLFQALAKAGNIGPSSTPAQIKAALYSLHGTTLNGYTAPLTYKKGVVTAADCAYVQSVSGGVVTTKKYGDKPICIPGSGQPYIKFLQAG